MARNKYPDYLRDSVAKEPFYPDYLRDSVAVEEPKKESKKTDWKKIITRLGAGVVAGKYGGASGIDAVKNIFDKQDTNKKNEKIRMAKEAIDRQKQEKQASADKLNTDLKQADLALKLKKLKGLTTAKKTKVVDPDKEDKKNVEKIVKKYGADRPVIQPATDDPDIQKKYGNELKEKGMRIGLAAEELDSVPNTLKKQNDYVKSFGSVNVLPRSQQNAIKSSMSEILNPGKREGIMDMQDRGGDPNLSPFERYQMGVDNLFSGNLKTLKDPYSDYIENAITDDPKQTNLNLMAAYSPLANNLPNNQKAMGFETGPDLLQSPEQKSILNSNQPIPRFDDNQGSSWWDQLKNKLVGEKPLDTFSGATPSINAVKDMSNYDPTSTQTLYAEGEVPQYDNSMVRNEIPMENPIRNKIGQIAATNPQDQAATLSVKLYDDLGIKSSDELLQATPDIMNIQEVANLRPEEQSKLFEYLFSMYDKMT